MAVSNAFGSNVFDICFCVGIPFLIQAMYGVPLTMDSVMHNTVHDHGFCHNHTVHDDGFFLNYTVHDGFFHNYTVHDGFRSQTNTPC